MTSHELARQLLSMPDLEVSASIDADEITGREHDKVYAESIIEVRIERNMIELHFETASCNYKGENHA